MNNKLIKGIEPNLTSYFYPYNTNIFENFSIGSVIGKGKKTINNIGRDEEKPKTIGRG